MVVQDLREELAGDIENAARKIESVRLEMSKVIIGQKRLIDRILIALLTGGIFSSRAFQELPKR